MNVRKFAPLMYTWEELEVLATLVDKEIRSVPMSAPRWPMLNSLRTSLREAQFTVDKESE